MSSYKWHGKCQVCCTDCMQAWLDAFDVAAKKPDIDAIIAENAFMAELQARIVPLIVQYNDFWTRYFYQ